MLSVGIDGGGEGIRTTSTPRFRATAMTVLRVPKSIPVDIEANGQSICSCSHGIPASSQKFPGERDLKTQKPLKKKKGTYQRHSWLRLVGDSPRHNIMVKRGKGR